MELQGITLSSGRSRSDFSISADEVKDKRDSIKSTVSEPNSDDAQTKNGIQSEELLQNIKALTEDGVYSVRFELDDATHDLIINLIDHEGELIRQVPSEEILGTRKMLAELRGNIFETES
jgi:flagellar protein FlaG